MAARARLTGLTIVVLLVLLSPAGAVVPELRQPSWAELSPEQRQLLAPLAREWDSLDGASRRKWLGIAKRYPTMKPEEQARVQRRLQEWIRLTPEQRNQARTQYKGLKDAPAAQKQVLREKWEQYKELPEEEKKRLAEKAGRVTGKAGPGKAVGLAPRPKMPPTGLEPLPSPSRTVAAPPPAPAATPPVEAVGPEEPPAQAPAAAEQPATEQPTAGQ